MTDHTQKTSSNLVDRPINNDTQDLLGTNIYVKALSNFIKESKMPITISIQGDWGSGKTSFLYSLQECLCDNDIQDKTISNVNNPHTKPFYSIYLSMWELSTLSTPDEAIENIMTSLLKQIRGLMKDSKCSSQMDKLIELPKKPLFRILSSGLRGFLKLTGKDQVYDTLSDFSQSVWTILTNTNKEDDLIPANFRKIVADAVQECIHDNGQGAKRGFIIFIDDLDRIEPEVAVRILDILKNYFDVDNCVFILAIDYDVIVKGLQAKFNNLDYNDRDVYQSYFDKIIQLPFNIPTESYQVNEYLEDSLSKIGFIEKAEANLDNIFKENYSTRLSFNEAISEITSLSIGKNPRSIKRLLNRLSLSLYIYKAKIEQLNTLSVQKIGNTPTYTESLNSIEKIILYALVCIQISYPDIHNLLLKDPDFIKWNHETLIKNELIDHAFYDNSESLDNYQSIINHIYNRDSQKLLAEKIIRILSIISNLCFLNDDTLKEKLQQLLKISSVTSVSDNQKQFYNISRQELFWNGFQKHAKSIPNYSSFYPSFIIRDTNIIELPITYDDNNSSLDLGQVTLIADVSKDEIEFKFNITLYNLTNNRKRELFQLLSSYITPYSFSSAPFSDNFLKGGLATKIHLSFEENWTEAYIWFTDRMLTLRDSLAPYFQEFCSSGPELPPRPVKYN